MSSTRTATPVGNDCPADARDKCVCLYSAGTDADSALLSRETKVANIDIVNAGGQIEAGFKAQCDVAAAGSVVKERFTTNARVRGAGSVVTKRNRTDGRVIVAGATMVEAARLCQLGRAAMDQRVVG